MVVVEDAKREPVDERKVGVFFRHNPMLAARGVEPEGSQVVKFLVSNSVGEWGR